MGISTGKRKRVSKKSKISWRKHTKVDDIEEFLEDQREEERLGGHLDIISDEQLFVLDKTAEEPQISLRQRRKLKAAQKPLKCFSALRPHTNVPDPIKKRNRVQTPEERKSILIKKKELGDRDKGVLKAKEINAIAERRLNELKKAKQEKRGEYLKDIWDDRKNFEIQNDPWTEKITKVHNLRNTGVPIKRTQKSVQEKQSLFPAVEIPHPGMSYNPSFKDHQDLLKTVAEEEVKIIKQEEHLTRVTRNMFRKVPQEQKQSEWVIEMSEGMPSKNEGNNLEDEDLDRISINPPVQNKKKSLKQRRKQREQLQLEKERKSIKLEKKKIGDIHRLKALQKDLEKTEKRHKKLREIRKVRAEKNKLKPKILSSTKFEDPGLEFQMGQDISGNLRALKKEGNLLTDRFKSLQKRNILEPSKRAHHKKAKVKKFKKPGHKEDWEKTVAKTIVVSKQ
ncbi:ribosome biogenesis protein NOP53 [Anthonomus grandis grandis]|uniref:ribosome biogenesis protein NOP53 n=1 Tax=Anthonomus grandis grandis TaxID=2921223 RepID=UPI0021655A4C|nr:ribosome biogenesis protein NOP53 [Anthonomus grandis grandis]XP_050299532.1 ribosome biogenesis protein NOP53 [Anthonomus grandis grandis]